MTGAWAPGREARGRPGRAALAAAVAAVCAVALLASCGGPTAPSRDAVVTCGQLDDYLAICDPACVNSWDCEGRYDETPLRTALLLDDCSDCLSLNLRRGWCSDCFVRDGSFSWSCADVLAEEMAVTCDWY